MNNTPDNNTNIPAGSNKRSSPLLKVLPIAVLAAVLVYFAAQVYNYFADPMTITLVYEAQAEDVISMEGWLVRTEEPLPALPVTMGEAEQVGLTLPETGVTAVVEKAQASSLEYRVDLPETLAAPIQQGQQVGTLTLCSGDTEVLTVPILAAESVPGRSWGRMFTDLLKQVVFLA